MPQDRKTKTVQELAAEIKSANPDFAKYTDESLVDAYLSANPEERPYVRYEIPAPKGPTTIGPPTPWYKSAVRGTVEALPAIGATIGGTAGLGAGAGVASGPGAIGGAIYGGMGGEAAKQLIERGMGWPVAPQTSEEAGERIAGAGAEQGAWEGLGFFRMPKAGKVAGEEVPWKDIYEMSRAPGIKMTPSEIRGVRPSFLEQTSSLGITSRGMIESYKEKTVAGAEKLATEMLDGLGPKMTAQASGKTMQDALDSAFEAFKRQGGAYYQRFRGAGGQAIPTSFDDVVRLAEDIEQQRTPMVKGKPVVTPSPLINPITGQPFAPVGTYSPFAPTVTRPLEKLPLESPAGMLLNYIKDLKTRPQNFDTAMQVRDFLGNFIFPGRDKLFADKESVAIAKRLWGELGNSLSKDAATFDRLNPGSTVARDWEVAKTFWKEGRERFENTFYAGLLKKNPEFVARTVLAGDVTNVQLLKKILTEYGTPAEKQRGAEAWFNFQRSFAQERIFSDPNEKQFTLSTLQGMKRRLNDLGGPQLREIYSDPSGQMFLKNVRAFAELMSRTGFKGGLAAGRWETMFDMIGLLGSVGVGTYRKDVGDVAVGFGMVQGIPAFLSAMFHSRTASAAFLKLLTMPPESWGRMSKASKTAIAGRIVSETVKALERSPQETYGTGTPLGEEAPNAQR